MKIVFKSVIFIILISITSCATKNTLPFSVGKENVWFLVQDNRTSANAPMYCLANQNVAKNQARPICFIAKIIDLRKIHHK